MTANNILCMLEGVSEGRRRVARIGRVVFFSCNLHNEKNHQIYLVEQSKRVISPCISVIAKTEQKKEGQNKKISLSNLIRKVKRIRDYKRTGYRQNLWLFSRSENYAIIQTEEFQDRAIRHRVPLERKIRRSRNLKVASQVDWLIDGGQCKTVSFLRRNPTVIATLSHADLTMLTWPCLKYSLSSLSIRSRLVSASSARRAEVFTPSPLLWVFSMMEQARNTKAGTVSCFSCLGISTSVQYCVSSLITSWNDNAAGCFGVTSFARRGSSERRKVCGFTRTATFLLLLLFSYLSDTSSATIDFFAKVCVLESQRCVGTRTYDLLFHKLREDTQIPFPRRKSHFVASR